MGIGTVDPDPVWVIGPGMNGPSKPLLERVVARHPSIVYRPATSR